MTPPKLKPGYADTSTLRHPREPDTVIVSQEDCDACRFVGYCGNNSVSPFTHVMAAFGVTGRKRYYFQTAATRGLPTS